MSSRSDDSPPPPISDAASEEAIPDPSASLGDGLADGLIDRYLLGTLGPDEGDGAVAFFADPVRKRILQRFLERVEGDADAIAPDTARTFEELRSRMYDAGQSPDARIGTQDPRKMALSGTGTLPWNGHARYHDVRRSLIRGIAGTVAVCGLGVLLSRSSDEAFHPQRFATGVGQRSTIRLTDGSRVILSPRTSITVVGDRVDVAGEAYFHVTPHLTRAFSVRTEDATVQVLGTAFVVRRYANEHGTRVVVEDGRVAVHSENRRRSLVLSANTMALVTDSNMAVTQGVVAKEYTGWGHGILSFDHATLHDVLSELAHAFGADIRITDTTLAQQILSLDVSMTNQSLPDILAPVCDAAGSHYIVKNDIYLVSPGRIARRTSTQAPQRYSIPKPEMHYGR